MWSYPSPASSLLGSQTGTCAVDPCYPWLRGLGTILAQTFESAGSSDRQFYRGQPVFGAALRAMVRRFIIVWIHYPELRGPKSIPALRARCDACTSIRA